MNTKRFVLTPEVSQGKSRRAGQHSAALVADAGGASSPLEPRVVLLLMSVY